MFYSKNNSVKIKEPNYPKKLFFHWRFYYMYTNHAVIQVNCQYILSGSRSISPRTLQSGLGSLCVIHMLAI